MFYSLLEYLACPACRQELTLQAAVEEPRATVMRTKDPRDTSTAVAEGLLVCTGCARWFPVRQGLPELLPDHLRDWDDDRAWLARQWPAEAHRAAATPPAAGTLTDAGAHYKRSEMEITKRALPEGFFGWSLVAPFNPSSPMFSFDLLARYVTTASRLGCGVNGTVFDLGVGTGWTTEWLVRLGYQAFGVDLVRDYILSGMPRRGHYLGHYIVGDTENIPLRAGSMDAALLFDAFHHVPDRPRAMSELARILRPGATMAITEPGIEHEHAAVSIDVMAQHGILEKGFDQAGLEGYIAGLPFADVRKFNSDTHPHDIYTVRRDGVFVTDSRSPRALVAAIEPDPAPRLSTGQPVPMTVTIRNTGDTVWLSKSEAEQGEVHFGAQLFDASHRLLKQDYARVLLPRDMAPGDAVRLRVDLPAIQQPGEFIVELDMIDTGFLWFKDYAYRPTPWPVHVSGTPRGNAPAATSEPRLRAESLAVPAAAPVVEPIPPPPPPSPSLARRLARRARRALAARW